MREKRKAVPLAGLQKAVTRVRPVMHDFELRCDHEGMTGKFFGHVIDYGMGEDVHPVIGQWLLHGQDVPGARCLMKLSGLPMPSISKTGRPTKTARDVAIFLAEKWFSGLPKPIKVRNEIVNMWSTNKFEGITEAGHVSKAIKRAKDAVPSLNDGCLMRRDGVAGDTKQAYMVFVEQGGRVDLVADPVGGGRCVVIQGRGWRWEYGAEEAVYVDFKGNSARITDETMFYPAPKKI